MGYRYFDKTGRKALFPFGFGLSYTDFAIRTEDISADADTITIKTRVKNIGSRTGKEVVQVYVSMPEDRLEKPYQDLVAYKKTKSLKPGQEETLEITFTLSDFASYDEAAAAYILEKGDYIIRTGNSSVNTEIVAVAGLDETITVRQVKNSLGKPDFTDISISSMAEESPETQEGKHLEIHGSVMTDWVITLMGSKKSVYRNALSDQVPMAGGDLFMPGGKADYQRLLTALQDGRVTREQLEINATRVIHMVEELL